MSDTISTEEELGGNIGAKRHKKGLFYLPSIIRPRKLQQEPKFSDIFTKTDVHGLSDWYAAPSWPMKLCWTVIVMTVVTLLFVQLYQSIYEFLDNPILTTYRLVNQPEGLLFPEVYICPSNPIHWRVRKELNVDGDWEKTHTDGLLKALSNFTGLVGLLAAKATQSELLTSFKGPRPVSRGRDKSNLEDQPELWIPEKVEDYFKAVGYPMNVFLRECAFNAHPLSCSSVTSEVFDSDFGKCFLIQVKRYQKAGALGLSLVLDLDFADAYPDLGESQPLFDGITLKVANKIDSGSQIALQLAPSTFSRVTLEAKKMRLLDRVGLNDHSSQLCIDKQQAVDKFTVIRSDQYSTGSCVQECVQRRVVHECGCYLPVDRRFINESVVASSVDSCTPAVVRDCVRPLLNRTRHNIGNCSKTCHMPCEYWDYQTTLSSSRFPSWRFTKDRFAPLGIVDDTPVVTEHICARPLLLPLSDQSCTLEEYFEERSNSTTEAWNVTEVWYWNRTMDDCAPYSYRWCSYRSSQNPQLWFGERNLFETRTECLNSCAYGDPCLAPMLLDGVKVTGVRPTMRYAWQPLSGRCLRRHFYGRDANQNCFTSRIECEKRCNATKSDPCKQDTKQLCTRPPYVTYDPLLGGCRFISGESIDTCLEKAENFFDSFDDCEDACDRSMIDNSTCQGPAFRPISGSECVIDTRFYHNPRLGECEPFYFFGCTNASGNNFKTKGDCEAKCVTSIRKPVGWRSSIRYPTEKANAANHNTASLNITREKWATGDMIILDIAFATLQYIELTQDNSMTFTTFVSNVGGQASLWVGCSVVTIIKIFIITAPVCCKRKKRNGEMVDTVAQRPAKGKKEDSAMI